MLCPKCACSTHVLDTRAAPGTRTVRRRRRCHQCHHRFSTLESMVGTPTYAGTAVVYRQELQNAVILARDLTAALRSLTVEHYP